MLWLLLDLLAILDYLVNLYIGRDAFYRCYQLAKGEV